jgi:multiple sugar transport system permease protein
MNQASSRIKDDRRIALMMISPALIGLLLFVILPFAIAILISFTNFRLGSPLPIEFLGFEQYRRIWLDPSFRRALLNNGLFALVVVPVQTDRY